MFVNKVILYDNKIIITYNISSQNEISVDVVEQAAFAALDECSSKLSLAPPAGACPCTQSALLYVRRIFYCRSSILSKTQPLFLRGGHFPSRFFVNTQSHRCDNLCVTFTNSGACPCTRSALLYVRRFFIAAHGSLFINPTLLFHHGRR